MGIVFNIVAGICLRYGEVEWTGWRAVFINTLEPSICGVDRMVSMINGGHGLYQAGEHSCNGLGVFNV